MTKEEKSIKYIRNVLKGRKDKRGKTDIDLALEIAIKALEQQPCEEAVSRRMVKDQMIKYGFHAPDMTVTEFVEGLPSVQPKPYKKGKWIENDKGVMFCSCCNTWFPKGRKEFMLNCPYCMAKMESEEQQKIFEKE